MIKNISVDINCDLGEGIVNEVELMPYLTSCSVACGGHYGDEKSMCKTVRLAIKNGVKIGAHPSYPDRDNFGRKSLKLEVEKLKISLLEQVTALESIVQIEQVELSHIKLHGALYNEAAKSKQLAELVVSMIKSLKKNYALFAPYGSELANKALMEGIEVKNEVFADRNYNDDLSLVSRTNQQGVLAKETVLEHIKHLKQGEVKTITGNLVSIKLDTICVHGDNPDAAEILKLLNDEFDQ